MKNSPLAKQKSNIEFATGVKFGSCVIKLLPSKCAAKCIRISREDCDNQDR